MCHDVNVVHDSRCRSQVFQSAPSAHDLARVIDVHNTIGDLEIHREERLSSEVFVREEVCSKTHMDWHNSVYSARL